MSYGEETRSVGRDDRAQERLDIGRQKETRAGRRSVIQMELHYEYT
jgi:hypothetical protein